MTDEPSGVDGTTDEAGEPDGTTPGDGDPDPTAHDVDAQYADATNLSARARVNARFSTAGRPLRFVREHVDVPAGARVLDLGCGTGSFWSVGADDPPAWRGTLLDRSPGMVAAARDRLAGDLPSHSDGEASALPTLEYAVADAGDLPFRAGTFDAVLAAQILYHVSDLDRTLAGIERVLVEGGRLYATTKTRTAKRRLYELLAEVTDGDAASPAASSTFVVENGRTPLERHFSTVDLRVLDASLVVDEADPLVEYARSLSDGASWSLDDADADRLRARVEEALADGPLVLQDLYGLYVATA